MCGEHETHPVTVAMTLGSSPRVRGTHDVELAVVDKRGIIPACAGNTPCDRGGDSRRRDHPRVCGEHSGTQYRIHASAGSSPRVRGTRDYIQFSKNFTGIIPACAGNTPPTGRATAQRRDHPRVCGEHCCSIVRTSGIRGSSPRVRGTRDNPRRALRTHRIIPACAGNTSGLLAEGDSVRDHPRVCGEHPHVRGFGGRGHGSSPRVRGTQTATEAESNLAGIIPACAGNTRAWPRPQCTPWDHPRVCGEHAPGCERSGR